MKKTVLDSSFILTCVKQKIDFFEEIKFMGMQVLIPVQVINEIKRLKNPNSRLTLKILQKNKFRKIDIGKGHVDKRIIKFAKENKDVIVATLDREIKRKVRNNKMVIREKKRLEVV